MSGRSARIAIGVLGTVWAVVGESIAMSAGRSASSGLLHLAIGLTYLYGGLAIWDHEPANRTGRLMTLVGLTWFIGTLDESGIPIVNEIAFALEDTSTVILVALVLAYPSGRLETLVDRVAVTIVAIGATPSISSSRRASRSSPTRAMVSTVAWRSRRCPPPSSSGAG